MSKKKSESPQTIGPTRPRPRKSLAKNRKAWHEYFVEDKFEAGGSLQGSEVKAVRRGDVSLDDSYIHLDKDGNPVWINGHIREYREANRLNHEPRRTRRLLLRQAEIEKIKTAVTRKGHTAIPLELYLDGPWIKLQLGLCRGKKSWDKREVIKERESKREIGRTMRKYVS